MYCSKIKITIEQKYKHKNVLIEKCHRPSDFFFKYKISSSIISLFDL